MRKYYFEWKKEGIGEKRELPLRSEKRAPEGKEKLSQFPGKGEMEKNDYPAWILQGREIYRELDPQAGKENSIAG